MDPEEYGYYTTYLYYNQELFASENYGEESVYRASKISELQFDPRKPKWLDFDYHSTELID